MRVLEPWVARPLRTFLDESSARLTLLMTSSGQVVAQHGLEGRPQDLIDPKDPKAMLTYQRYAARLVERGFIVYVPQNPYIHGERFRVLSRRESTGANLVFVHYPATSEVD